MVGVVRPGAAVVGSLRGDVVGSHRGVVAGLHRGAVVVAFLVGVVAVVVVDLRREVGEEDSPRVGGAVGAIEQGCRSLGKKNVSIDSSAAFLFLFLFLLLVDVLYITKSGLFLNH